MKTRLIVFLAGVALLVVTAPAAFAEHCQRCRFDPQTGTVGCAPAVNLFAGYPECWEVSESACEFAGEQCAPHGSGFLPLASEYSVASVERLDEPRTSTDETRMAAADLPNPVTR